MALLAQRVEAGAYDAEMLGTGKRAEASGDSLFHLGHAHGALARVVGDRYGRVAYEAQDSVGVWAEAA